MRRALSLSALLLAAVSLPVSAMAQDYSRDRRDGPRSGQGGGRAAQTVRLQAGFTPDPHTVRLTAGGDRPAEQFERGCVGFVAGAPDVEVQYQAGSFPLIFETESQGDTTLLVRTPDRGWLCDDDSRGGYDARVGIENPTSGAYAVWVGTFGEQPTPALLHITEIAQSDFGGGFDIEDTPEITPRARPTHGAGSLRNRGRGEPLSVRLQAGGPSSATQVGCFGMVSQAPSYRLSYRGGNRPLNIAARSDAGDVVLVVRGPDGEWVCDDDSGGGYNALLAFDRPISGDYSIWVGVFAGEPVPAVLEIREAR